MQAKQEKRWRDFEGARECARGLGLKSKEDWRKWSSSGQRPPDIPSNPQNIYKDAGWLGWGDWLGTGNAKKRSFRPYEEAREFARGLGLTGWNDWLAYRRRGEKPDDIPAHPDRTYKKEGWVSWGDFLGTGNTHPGEKEFRSFEEAREFVRGLGLRNYVEWTEYRKSGSRPHDIPASPNNAYRDSGWAGYGDFLGTGYVAHQDRRYRSYEEARDFVRTLGLKNSVEWKEYCQSGNKPDDIPATPWHIYGKKRR